MSAPYRFSANTGFLWKERPFLERIRAAAAAGFDAVEFHDEAQTADPHALRAVLAETGLPVLGLNTRMGETAGLAAFPDRAAEAEADIRAAFAVAREVGARAVHVLAGKTEAAGVPTAAARAAFAAALRRALAEAGDLKILLEPLSARAMPGYFLRRLEDAEALILEIGDPRLTILFDCFHVAAEGHDVAHAFRRHAAHIGHVQIASYPERAEPGPGGVLDFATLLAAFRAEGYTGAFGCEYRPAGTVEAGLGWRDALAALR